MGVNCISFGNKAYIQERYFIIMKFLHIGYSGHTQPGVLQQLEFERQAASDLGLDWDIVFFSHGKESNSFVHTTGKEKNGSGFFLKVYLYFLLRITVVKWLLKYRCQYDVVLIRYMAGDPFLLCLGFLVKNFVTVHHTVEEREIKLNNSAGRVLGIIMEFLASKFLISRAKGVIAVTGEILDYELSRTSCRAGFVYPNGIRVDDKLVLRDSRNGKAKFIFCGARDYPWNGLDYIYQEIRNYPNFDFELHIVGDIEESFIDSRVVYHGVLDQEVLKCLYSKMDVGLGTFALYRQGMREACSLKSREYLLNGLPVMADHKDSAIPDTFPFYKKSYFDLNESIDFAMGLRQITKDKIYIEASPYLDKTEWLRKLNVWVTKVANC